MALPKRSSARVEKLKSAKYASSQLGARLREAREKKGITLRAMAGVIGVSPGLVSQIERGTVTPSVGTLYNMASQLGIALDDLFVTSAARSARDSSQLSHAAGNFSRSVDLIQRPGKRDLITLAGGVT